MPVVLCGARFFCNLFRHRSSRKAILANASTVLDAASDQVCKDAFCVFERFLTGDTVEVHIDARYGKYSPILS